MSNPNVIIIFWNITKNLSHQNKNHFRPITLDDIYHCGLFDSVGQSDVSLNLAALSENNYESIFDLLLVLQKTTTSYLRSRSLETESHLQQSTSEKENFKRELTVLIQVNSDI